MDKKEYYKLREVILGLREGYQQQANEWKKLSEMISYDKDVIRDVDFMFWRGSEHPPGMQLDCCFKLYRNFFGKCKDILIDKVGYCYDEKRRVLLTMEDFPLDIIQAQDSRCVAKTSNPEQFYQEVTSLAQREFLNYICGTARSDNDDTKLLFRSFNTDVNNSKMSMMYYSLFDVFGVFSRDSLLTSSDFEQLFETPISKDKLPPYHQELINHTQAAQKPIILPDDCVVTDTALFDIMEEPTQVVLRKKR